MTRISKKVACDMFNAGFRVYLTPSKVRLGGMWILPFPIVKNEYNDFDKEVNAYQYYNCTNETGMRVHFYIEN